MQTIDLNQSVKTAIVGVPVEIANQRVPLQANPPRPTFLQRFCQKADQILTEGNFYRLVAAAIVIAGAFSPHVLIAILAIIVGGMFWAKCKEMDDTPIFNFSNFFQTSAVSS